MLAGKIQERYGVTKEEAERQKLISGVLIFLFGLALRNMLKVK